MEWKYSKSVYQVQSVPLNSCHQHYPCILYPRPSSFLRGQPFHLRSLGFTTSPEQSTGAREVVLSQPRRWRRRRNTSVFWRSWFWSKSEKNTNRRPMTRWRTWGGTSGTTCWNGRREMTVCDELKAWRLLKEQTRLKATVQSKIDQNMQCRKDKMYITNKHVPSTDSYS